VTLTLHADLVDITTLRVDAIINAANEQLLEGGGVCGAIFCAAGPGLAEACAKVTPCPTGEARITPGFKLPARFIIHAVGPVWHGGGQGEGELLGSAYRSCLRLAREHGLQSIAFPAISTGVYGYPIADATAIAVRVCREAAEGAGVNEVVFACFGNEVLETYRSELGERER